MDTMKKAVKKLHEAASLLYPNFERYERGQWHNSAARDLFQSVQNAVAKYEGETAQAKKEHDEAKAEKRAGNRGNITTVEKEKIEAWLLGLCAFDDYEKVLGTLDLTTREGKAIALQEVFMAEVGRWNIPQVGRMTALENWLSGLPSVLSVPFTYGDIIAQSKELGRIPKNATPKQEEHVCETWFSWVAMRILGLWDSVGIK